MKRTLKICIIIISILMILPLSLSVIAPSAIVLRSGESISLTLGLPLKGRITGENLPVAASGDIPVSGNINLDMKSPVLLRGIKSGNANLILSFMGIPIKNSTITVLPNQELIPIGKAVAMELETDGILVLGTGEVHTASGKYISPCSGILKSGDLIKKAGNTTLTDKESLIASVENSTSDKIRLTIERNGEIIQKEVISVKSMESGRKKLGIWVRDSTRGIGTITCCTKDGKFYALGHPVTDVDTGSLMKIRSGTIMPTSIISVNKGKKGNPGELVGSTVKKEKTGYVTTNTPCGITGRLNSVPQNINPCKIALKNEVKEGNASILVNTEGNKVISYNIKIENTDTLSLDKSKAMVIRIIDNSLIEKTGGIVQGMSGAPIIQNGCLVGAVTHVFIQNPTKGYAIYIEDMIK